LTTFKSLLDSWNPEEWSEIQDVWSDLVPDSLRIEPRVVRKFRGKTLTNRQAGYVFESWVIAAFRLSGFSGHSPFTVPRAANKRALEHVDGLVFDGYQGFLIESKFSLKGVDFVPVAQLHVCVEHRPVGTLGLLFSAFGFTEPAVELSTMLHPIRVLMIDQNDLKWANDSPKRFRTMIRLK